MRRRGGLVSSLSRDGNVTSCAVRSVALARGARLAALDAPSARRAHASGSTGAAAAAGLRPSEREGREDDAGAAERDDGEARGSRHATLASSSSWICSRFLTEPCSIMRISRSSEWPRRLPRASVRSACSSLGRSMRSVRRDAEKIASAAAYTRRIASIHARRARPSCRSPSEVFPARHELARDACGKMGSSFRRVK